VAPGDLALRPPLRSETVSTPGRSITRNPLVLIAGVLLMLSGVVGSIGFMMVLGGGAGVVEVLYLVVGLVVAILSIAAGWRVLHEDERGRSLGLVLAVVGLILALFSLLGTGVLVMSVLMNAFVIFVLLTRAKEFA
jgi:hypothetical protein